MALRQMPSHGRLLPPPRGAPGAGIMLPCLLWAPGILEGQEQRTLTPPCRGGHLVLFWGSKAIVRLPPLGQGRQLVGLYFACDPQKTSQKASGLSGSPGRPTPIAWLRAFLLDPPAQGSSFRGELCLGWPRHSNYDRKPFLESAGLQRASWAVHRGRDPQGAGEEPKGLDQGPGHCLGPSWFWKIPKCKCPLGFGVLGAWEALTRPRDSGREIAGFLA